MMSLQVVDLGQNIGESCLGIGTFILAVNNEAVHMTAALYCGSLTLAIQLGEEPSLKALPRSACSAALLVKHSWPSHRNTVEPPCRLATATRLLSDLRI